MIRSQNQLRAAFQRGETVAKQTMFTETGWRFCTTESGETVNRAILGKLVAKGEVKPIAYDIAGEPYQYGPAS